MEIDVVQQYNSTMDSVNLINNGKPLGISEADWLDMVSRNKEHIKIMLAKDFWTDEDLTPFENAVGIK